MEKPAAIPGAVTMHGGVLPDWGSPDVQINTVGAWRAGDIHTCSVHGAEDVRLGVDHVLINGKPACRMGDFLQGSGPSNRIVSGSSNVFIGRPTFHGTGSKENLDWFCKHWCALKKDWPNLTPEERRRRYEQILQYQFARLGMPPPRLRLDAPPSSAGTFKASTWTVGLPPEAFDDNGSPPKMPDRLGEATLHETRHAEQVFAAARERAGRHQGGAAAGPDPGASNDRLSQEELDELSSLPDHVDQAAYQNPLDPSSPEGKWARLQSDEQLSEAGRKQFNDIIREYDESYRQAGGDSKRHADAVQAYRDRPGGADADEVGELIGGCAC